MDDLQFQTADYGEGGRKCGRCQQSLSHSYFQFSGVDICPECAKTIESLQARPTNSMFLKGALYGAGAAILCSLGWATIILVSGLEIGLIAILVGFLIGKAIRIGTGGLGGRRCQIAAVALTYLAITMSYVPVTIYYMATGEFDDAAIEETTDANGAPVAAAAAGEIPAAGAAEENAEAEAIVASERATEENTEPPSLLGWILVIGILAATMLFAPFLDLTSGIGGILGIVIIGIGLQQAWKHTARDDRALAGPFTLDTPPDLPAPAESDA